MILAKYGVACIVSFPLIKAGSNNFAGTGDYTEASGDVKIIKDRTAGGANPTNSLGANLVGNSTEWALQLTAAEMQAKEIVIKIADATTKAIEDTQINIYTYGDANAWMPFDLGTATQSVNLASILGTALTESTAGWIANAFKTFFNIGSPTGTVNTIPTVSNLTNAPSNGDFTATMKASITTAATAATPSVTVSDKTNFSLSSAGIGAIWAYATSTITTAGSIGKWILDNLNATVSSRSTYAGADTSGTTTLLSLLTPTRAALLDNLNVGGPVASQADINAINQSASKRILLATVAQYERPESGTVTYTVEARTFDGDGAATNADTTPTLTANGMLSGSLSGNLASATNPATGVYRWSYTVASSAVLEQVRFDVSATIGGSAFTLSCYTQTVDLVASTWTGADRTKLEAIFDKLPANAIADQSLLATAIDALPTNSELSTALASSDDATLAAIAALNNLSEVQVQAAAAAALAAYDVATTTNTDGLQGILNKFDQMVEFVGTDWRFRDVSLAMAPVTPEGPTAEEIRIEIDTHSTQLAQIVERTALLPDNPAAEGSQMALVPSAIAPETLSTAAGNKIADHVHRRSWSLLEASSDGDTLSKDSSYGAARQIQKSSVSGNTLTIQKTNGTTLGTRTVSTSPTAEPVTGVN